MKDTLSKGRLNKKAIEQYFRSNHKWSTAKDITRATGIDKNSVHNHCRNMIAVGLLEESLFFLEPPEAGRNRKVIHYRKKLNSHQLPRR